MAAMLERPGVPPTKSGTGSASLLTRPCRCSSTHPRVPSQYPQSAPSLTRRSCAPCSSTSTCSCSSSAPVRTRRLLQELRLGSGRVPVQMWAADCLAALEPIQPDLGAALCVPIRCDRTRGAQRRRPTGAAGECRRPHRGSSTKPCFSANCVARSPARKV